MKPKVYGLIDKNSGYFWGWSLQSTPEAAMDAVDRLNHESHSYDRVSPHDYDVTYFVYDLTGLVDTSKGLYEEGLYEDGTDEELIDLVSNCPLVGAYARKETE